MRSGFEGIAIIERAAQRTVELCGRMRRQLATENERPRLRCAAAPLEQIIQFANALLAACCNAGTGSGEHYASRRIACSDRDFTRGKLSNKLSQLDFRFRHCTTTLQGSKNPFGFSR